MYTRRSDTNYRTEVTAAPTERVLIIVEILAAQAPLSLGDIAELTGFSKASVWRCVDTLRARGWVRMRLGDHKIELTHRVDQSFSQAHFSDEEFDPFFGLMAKLEESDGAGAELVAFKSAGSLTIVERTTRNRSEMMPAISLVSDEIAFAVQLACTETALRKHLSAFVAAASFDDAQRITSGEHVKHLHSMTCPIWEEYGVTICVPIIGHWGTPAAMKLIRRSPLLLPERLMELALEFHHFNEKVLLAQSAELPKSFRSIKDRFRLTFGVSS